MSSKEFLSSFGAGIIIGLWITIGLIECSSHASTPYERGQVDALTGKAHWYLKQKDDGSVHWEHSDTVITNPTEVRR